MPKVSFVISVHNGEAYLEECIDSVLNQTFKDFECIVLNNGSTDRTPEILRQYTDPRLRIIHQENLGVSPSLNKGVHLSDSDLIARLDADDLAFTQRLEKQAEFMIQNPQVVLCGSRFRELIGGKSFSQKVAFIETDEAIKKSLSLFNPFGHSTIVLRKKTFIKSGGYSDKLKYGLDYELWLRMLAHGEGHNLKDELSAIRISGQSLSGQNERMQKLEGLAIRWKAFKQFGGNSFKILYYFSKSLVGLIFLSKRHSNR